MVRQTRRLRRSIRLLTGGLWLTATLLVRHDAVADRVSGDISGDVSILRDGSKKQDRSNAVVYLRGGPASPADSSSSVQRVYQRDKQFSPSVVVAPLGSTVEFPNQDKIFHNVFSLSSAARFDLGLYKSGTSKSIKAKKLGVIDVFCNIHPQMAAKILVLDTKYYAITEADGRFKIRGVPPGNYELVVWQPKGKESTRAITISSGQHLAAHLEVVETTERERHRRKDGTPYGRYE
jgi:plastocyanin